MRFKAVLITIILLQFSNDCVSQNATYNNLSATTFTLRNGAANHNGWGENADNSVDVRPNLTGYTSFVMNHHFGLTFSAHSYYGGIRFYNQTYPSHPLSVADGAKMVMALTQGKVGIGTTTPGGSLHIYEPAADHTYSILERSNNAYQAFRVFAPAGAASTSNPRWLMGMKQSSSDFEIQTWDGTASTERFYIKSDGKVGIGTANPSSELEVAGITQSRKFLMKNNWDNVIVSEQDSENFHLIGTYNGWGAKTVFVAGVNISNAPSSYTNVTTERVVIGNPYHNNKYLAVDFVSGGVGIGTTSPGSFKLAVEGKIGARKVVVTESPWADYVFEADYRLRSLKEVEDFIRQNKHLPEVPTAREIEEKGNDLASNQAILLKKIEELTLYLIKQEKDMESLKSEILQLKNAKQ